MDSISSPAGDLLNAAAQVKLQAERRAGQILAGMGLRKGRKSKCNTMLPLSELGIRKIQASRWQQIASVPESRLAGHFRQCVERQNAEAVKRLYLDRQAGMLLARMELRGGDRKSNGHDVRLIKSLKDIGLTKDQSARWQKLAAIAEDVIAEYVSRHAISEPEQVIELVESNSNQREKTMEQRAREFSWLAEAKAKLARLRQSAAGGKKPGALPSNLTEALGDPGEAKRQAAEELGMSVNTAKAAAAVVQEIDAATAAGDTARAERLREKLNTSPAAG